MSLSTGHSGRGCRLERKDDYVLSWSPPVLTDMQLLHARYHDHSFAPHWHQEHAFGVIDAGIEQFEYRGRAHVAPVNSLIMLNAMEVHTGRSLNSDGWGFRMFYVPVQSLEALAREAGLGASGKLHFPHPVAANPTLATQLLALHASLEDRGSTIDQLASESSMIAVFSSLLEQHTWAGSCVNMMLDGKRSGGIKDARAYIAAHWMEEIPLTDLASIAELSRYHFLRMFRRTYGLTPHALQIQLKVDHAQILLRKGVTTVAAARLTGFFDQSHLTRHFKKLLGMTPGQFAAQ